MPSPISLNAVKTAIPTSLSQLANDTSFVASTGTVATASKLATPRLINGVAFDGSTDITIGGGTSAPIYLTGNTTLTSAAYSNFYYCITNFTLTLPLATAEDIGKSFTVFALDGSALINIATQSSQGLISNGMNAVALNIGPGDSYTFYNILKPGSAWMCTGGGTIGYGQTWKNKLSVRTIGVTYTNTTGKPIMVHVSSGTGNGLYSFFAATVGGMIIHSSMAPAANGIAALTFIVPINSTYKVDGNSTATPWQWNEMTS